MTYRGYQDDKFLLDQDSFKHFSKMTLGRSEHKIFTLANSTSGKKWPYS